VSRSLIMVIRNIRDSERISGKWSIAGRNTEAKRVDSETEVFMRMMLSINDRSSSKLRISCDSEPSIKFKRRTSDSTQQSTTVRCTNVFLLNYTCSAFEFLYVILLGYALSLPVEHRTTSVSYATTATASMFAKLFETCCPHLFHEISFS